MPRIHRFLRLPEIRTEARRHAALGLHLGLDFTDPAALFEGGWDRDARDLGRWLHGFGLHTIARGPGRDLPLSARDPYVQDHVRACHDRALAATMHLGASDYLVRLGSLHGLARSERLARRECEARMVLDLAGRARSRGIRLLVQHQLEPDAESLELVVEGLRAAGGGFVFSPARALWAGFPDIEGFLDRNAALLAGADLSDVCPADLEPRPPGAGLLSDWAGLQDFLRRPAIGFFVAEAPIEATESLVLAVNALAQRAGPVPEPALADPSGRA